MDYRIVSFEKYLVHTLKKNDYSFYYNFSTILVVLLRMYKFIASCCCNLHASCCFNYWSSIVDGVYYHTASKSISNGNPYRIKYYETTSIKASTAIQQRGKVPVLIDY